MTTPPAIPRTRPARRHALGGVLLAGGLSLLVGATSFAADYEREVKPLLERRCFSCHSRLQQKGGLRLDAGALIHKGGKDGPVLEPGNAGKSALVARIQSTDESERMPPEGKPLKPEEIALLRSWIDSGAKFPQDEVVPSSPADHWAFQPVRRSAIPIVRDASWCRQPIDHFIRATLDKAGVPPAPAAAPDRLLRRIHLDLTGLPPTLAEQDAFAARVEAAGADTALDEVVDALLARPQYGERWARHWLDLVRYADSNGYERDAAKPFVWRYRDWVIRALNADLPYDRFAIAQLAGDEQPDATAESLLATGMLRLGHWDDEPADPETDRYDQLDDIVSTTSQVFLGLTLGCARCHDHKFEPLSTRDYYSMVAVFNPLKRPQNGRTELTLPAGSPAELEALAAADARIAKLENTIGSTRAGLRDRWMATGRSRLPEETLAAWRVPAGQRTEAQKKLATEAAPRIDAELAADTTFQPEVARLAGLERELAETRAARPDLPQGYFLNEPGGRPPATHVLLRGNPRRTGAEVTPAAPVVAARNGSEFPAATGRTSGRRLGLAQWIASRDNPLTARVIVNRVWQQHFGAGLVRTPSDFGLMGERPTHPELLDWLADWFTHEGGWSLKRLHRLILTSTAWRLSRAGASEADPENRLLAHLPHKRLEAEAIRDGILAVSGRLNPSMFGPPMFPSIPDAAVEANTDRQSIWKPSAEDEASRRTVYAFIKRGLVIPMLEVFDLCDTVNSTSRRPVTTVAPQALTLFNGDFVQAQARALAARLEREAGPAAAAQVELAFRLALARRPTAAEQSSMQQFLRTEEERARAEAANGTRPLDATEARRLAREQLCRVILNLNEFVYPD